MKREELQRIMNKLQEVKAELEYERNRTKALRKLETGISGDYKYLRRTENVIRMIEEKYKTQTLMQLQSCMENLENYGKYIERAERTLEMIEEYELYSKKDFIYVVERTIEMIKEDLESSEEATVIEAIKKGYKDAKDMASEVITEKVEQLKGVGKQIERKVKSTLRNWLLSEDGEEDWSSKNLMAGIKFIPAFLKVFKLVER